MNREAGTTQTLQERLDEDRAELTLREQLLRALNGHPVHRDSALDILRRWDAMERFIEEARSLWK
jgi:hypothetical protein